MLPSWNCDETEAEMPTASYNGNIFMFEKYRWSKLCVEEVHVTITTPVYYMVLTTEYGDGEDIKAG